MAEAAPSLNLFFTGTDTGVGRTHTGVQILRAARGTGLRCVGVKPICCGDRNDTERLLAALTAEWQAEMSFYGNVAVP